MVLVSWCHTPASVAGRNHACVEPHSACRMHDTDFGVSSFSLALQVFLIEVHTSLALYRCCSLK